MPDSSNPALPGFNVIFKLIGGVALMTGGTVALLIALAFWGIHEISEASLPRVLRRTADSCDTSTSGPAGE